MASIAILEDDLEFLALLEKSLQRHGHSTVSFTSARSALDYLGTDRVDLIISDIFVRNKGYALPDGGISLVWGIKNLPLQRRNPTPIIIITGVRDDETVQAALDAMQVDRAAAVLFKPFDPQTLLDCVNRLLPSAASSD